MSSTVNKKDMSMDDILASIRSYVSEGQNLPKSEVASTASNNVIQLTDEVIAIDSISMPLSSLPPIQNNNVQNYHESTNSTQDNPFNRLKGEISASTTPILSADDLLNQLASPLIKSWLDQNLRKIVEEIVQKEIDKSRRG